MLSFYILMNAHLFGVKNAVKVVQIVNKIYNK